MLLSTMIMTSLSSLCTQVIAEETKQVTNNYLALYKDGKQICDAQGKNVLKPQKITSNTPVPIGSVSKFLTAVIAFKLESLGKIDVYEDIEKVIPELKPHVERFGRVNLVDLLSHTSGFPSRGFDKAQETRFKQSIEIINKSNFKSRKPNYSNANYSIAGVFLERKMGIPLKEIFTTYLVKPLKLKNTYFGDSAKDVPIKIYERQGKIIKEAQHWELQEMDAAGQYIASFDDLVTILDNVFNKSDYLDRKTRTMFLAITRPHFEYEMYFGAGYDISMDKPVRYSIGGDLPYASIRIKILPFKKSYALYFNTEYGINDLTESLVHKAKKIYEKEDVKVGNKIANKFEEYFKNPKSLDFVSKSLIVKEPNVKEVFKQLSLHKDKNSKVKYDKVTKTGGYVVSMKVGGKDFYLAVHLNDENKVKGLYAGFDEFH